METALLRSFMHVAQAATHAERGVAMDATLTPRATINVEAGVLESAKFNEVLIKTAANALAQDEPIITNNMISDPKLAPDTNVHFNDLRLVVAIPLAGEGVIYLDQHVRHGVFERDTIDKLMMLARQVAADADIDPHDLAALYEKL